MFVYVCICRCTSIKRHIVQQCCYRLVDLFLLIILTREWHACMLYVYMYVFEVIHENLIINFFTNHSEIEL